MSMITKFKSGDWPWDVNLMNDLSEFEGKQYKNKKKYEWVWYYWPKLYSLIALFVSEFFFCRRSWKHNCASRDNIYVFLIPLHAGCTGRLSFVLHEYAGVWHCQQYLVVISATKLSHWRRRINKCKICMHRMEGGKRTGEWDGGKRNEWVGGRKEGRKDRKNVERCRNKLR